MDDSNDFWFNPRTAILWIRSRVLQLTMLVQSVIAVLLGFDYIAWTEEQTGLVMALVGGVLSLAAYADQVQLRDALSMHELDKSRRGLELEAVDALGRELLDRSVRESLMWKSQTPDQPTLD